MKSPALFLLEVTLLLLVSSCNGQRQRKWYDPEDEVGQCNPSDTCLCQFNGRWTVLDSYFELKKYSSELTNIEYWMKDMDLIKLFEQITVMSRELDVFEARVQNMSVDASLKEYSAMEKRLAILATGVDEALRDGVHEDEILKKESRMTNISISMGKIWSENPYASKDDLNDEVVELTAKMSSCQLMTDGSYFRGDSLPLNLQEDWCDLYEPVSFGDSLAHGTSTYAMGNWFKDPKPVSKGNITTVWLRGYSAYHSYLTYVYAKNYNEFIDILAQKRWSPVAHNSRSYGLGYMMYNGSLYYHYGTEIFKYTLSNGAIHKVPLSPSSTEYLRHGTTTRVDMKADEYGLYAIYTDASNDEKLIIKQIDPKTLETIKTWNTNRHKATVCATIMICGKLYTLDNCWSRLETENHHKQYTYDILSGKETYSKWHLTSKFGHIWMVGYNPRERLLFAWDNGHLVTYSINWQRKATLPTLT